MEKILYFQSSAHAESKLFPVKVAPLASAQSDQRLRYLFFWKALIPLAARTISMFKLFSIGVAPITQLGTCVIKIITFKGGHLIW